MSEQAVEDRRGWGSEIMRVALYSILVLLAMLLCIYSRKILRLCTRSWCMTAICGAPHEFNGPFHCLLRSSVCNRDLAISLCVATSSGYPSIFPSLARGTKRLELRISSPKL